MGHSNLAEWNLEASMPVPGLAEKWEIEGDGKAYVFHLRKGLKWSDGKPFTADDLVFYYKQVYLNKTLRPSPPTWLMAGGKPMTLTKIDDTTIRIEFAAANGLLLKFLAFPTPGMEIITPAHYLKQFHPDFVSAAKLKAETKAAKFQTWDQLWADRADPWNNPDVPVLGAWQVVQPPRKNNTTASMVRNPYYWKTDPDGRQLPYIDKIDYSFLSAETLGLRAAGGEIDFDGVDVQFSTVPLLAKSAKEHNYSVYRWKPDDGILTIYINQTHKDPVLRKVFQNKDFRIGLSVAINRKEINSALLAGQGSYLQPVAQPEDEYWMQGFGSNYLTYDVAEANKRLDKAGLTRRGSDGMRLRPDGKKLQINVLTFPLGVGVPVIDGYQYVQRYWKAVGINMQIQNVSQDLFYKKAPDCDYDFCGYGSAAGYHWDIDPLWYVPTSSFTYWACLYGKWYESGGTAGEKPPGVYRQLQLWYDELRGTADRKRQLDLGHKILQQHNENCWIIGIVRIPFQPIVVSNDMMNVRKDAVSSFRTGLDETTLVEQLYFKNPEKH
jgi:peptide/nickel transport system substrate-binding protein